jgi:hypothetical protein
MLAARSRQSARRDMPVPRHAAQVLCELAGKVVASSRPPCWPRPMAKPTASTGPCWTSGPRRAAGTGCGQGTWGGQNGCHDGRCAGRPRSVQWPTRLGERRVLRREAGRAPAGCLGRVLACCRGHRYAPETAAAGGADGPGPGGGHGNPGGQNRQRPNRGGRTLFQRFRRGRVGHLRGGPEGCTVLRRADRASVPDLLQLRAHPARVGRAWSSARAAARPGGRDGGSLAARRLADRSGWSGPARVRLGGAGLPGRLDGRRGRPADGARPDERTGARHTWSQRALRGHGTAGRAAGPSGLHLNNRIRSRRARAWSCQGGLDRDPRPVRRQARVRRSCT